MLAQAFALIFSVIFSILTIIGILGNMLVIIAIGTDRKMRACVMNILLLNLAVADLSNVVLAIGEWSPAVFLSRPKWILPEFLCPINRYLECVFLYASISTQLIVCMERYIATIHPMRARAWCSRKTALKAIAIAWSLAGLFALPYAVMHGIGMNKSGEIQCTNVAQAEEWWRNYKMVEFFLYFVFPCAVILIVYSRVASVLWASNPTLKSESSSHVVQEGTARQLATRRNVVKMLVACACVYFLCYAPIQALFISKSIFNTRVHPPYAAILLLNALAVTCSASNPLLYALFSTRFRKRLKSLLSPISLVASKTDRYSSINNGPRNSIPVYSL